MQVFTTTREAKEFLVSRIVAEAQREDMPLSDVEEKMLYFSETAWTLPEILDVNRAFDREYEVDEYENKIVVPIRGFRNYACQRSSSELELWDEAVRVLRKEDHYLLVMVDIAASAPILGQLRLEQSDQGRFAKLILAGFVGFLICSILLMAYMWLKN